MSNPVKQLSEVLNPHITTSKLGVVKKSNKNYTIDVVIIDDFGNETEETYEQVAISILQTSVDSGIFFSPVVEQVAVLLCIKSDSPICVGFLPDKDTDIKIDDLLIKHKDSSITFLKNGDLKLIASGEVTVDASKVNITGDAIVAGDTSDHTSAMSKLRADTSSELQKIWDALAQLSTTPAVIGAPSTNNPASITVANINKISIKQKYQNKK